MALEIEGETADGLSKSINALTLAEAQAVTLLSDVTSNPERLGGCAATDSQLAIPAPAMDREGQELPTSDLSFTIMKDLFRAAKNAEPGSPQSFWSHTLYRGPSISGEPARVKIHYCRSKHTTERTLNYFIDQKVLGFDIEWQPEATRRQGPKQNVSLIQLASEERIALFHIALYPKSEGADLAAPSLKRIMEDPKVTKVGVAIKADCTRLRKFLGIEARGIFELSHLHKLVKFSELRDFRQINKRLVSLSSQVQEHLDLPLFKGEVVRGSNWTQPLNMDQILYAAADSYAAIQLFDSLEMKRKSLDPIPPRPHHVEQNRAICFVPGVELGADDVLEGLELEDDGVQQTRKANDCRTYASKDAGRADLTVEDHLPLTPSSNPSAVIDAVANEVTFHTSTAPDRASKHHLLVTADSRCSRLGNTQTGKRATTSSLRTYFLWFDNPNLSLSEITTLLRDPPLQESTVRGYILEAIRAEKLPFERLRLKEIVDHIPEQIARKRYGWAKKLFEEGDVSKVKVQNVSADQFAFT